MSTLNKILIAVFFALALAISVEFYFYFNTPKSSSTAPSSVPTQQSGMVHSAKTPTPQSALKQTDNVKVSTSQGLAVSAATKDVVLSYMNALQSTVVSDVSLDVTFKGQLVSLDKNGILEDGTKFKYRIKISEQNRINSVIERSIDNDNVVFFQQVGSKKTLMNPSDLKIGDNIIINRHLNLINPDDPNTNTIEIIYKFPSAH